MTYLIMYSCTCKTRQTRQTRRHSPNSLPSTRQTRRHSSSRLPSTRQTRRHSPKAIFEKNVTRLDTFARVIRHSGEFGASGHCLIKRQKTKQKTKVIKSTAKLWHHSMCMCSNTNLKQRDVYIKQEHNVNQLMDSYVLNKIFCQKDVCFWQLL